MDLEYVSLLSGRVYSQLSFDGLYATVMSQSIVTHTHTHNTHE